MNFIIKKNNKKEFCRGHKVKFERTMKHASGKVKLAKSLELRGSGWAKDINLAFISI